MKLLCTIVFALAITTVLCNCASDKILDSYRGKYYSPVNKAYIVYSKPKGSKSIGTSSFSETDHMTLFFPTNKDAISVAKKIGATHVRFEQRSQRKQVSQPTSRSRVVGSEYYDELPPERHTGFTGYARNQKIHHASLEHSNVEHEYKIFWFQAEFYRLNSLLINLDREQNKPIKTKSCKQNPRFNNFKFWATSRQVVIVSNSTSRNINKSINKGEMLWTVQ